MLTKSDLRLFASLSIFAALQLVSLPNAGAEISTKFSKSRITELVEPIALYPDPLLQQILPAATFPDQIADAALLIRSKSDAELIKDQDWDNSVKIIATYQGVLKMMYSKLDWTTDLGNAFLDQNKDVLDEIQTLRAKAKEVGNLESSEKQKVSSTKNSKGDTVITIEPGESKVIYVPQETTTVVYTEPVNTTANILVPMATFGLGLALGSAMSNDNDNYYYGGPWGGPMWSGDNSWADVRRARNEDINDRVMDRQDFRQDQKSGRQDFRQDWAKNNPGQINKANLDKSKQKIQANQPAREAKLNNARASLNSQDLNRGQVSQRAKTSASSWSGSGAGSFSNRASSRGSFSRGSGGGSFSRGSGGGGFSRGSFGGGGGRGGSRGRR